MISDNISIYGKKIKKFLKYMGVKFISLTMNTSNFSSVVFEYNEKRYIIHLEDYIIKNIGSYYSTLYSYVNLAIANDWMPYLEEDYI